MTKINDGNNIVPNMPNIMNSLANVKSGDLQSERSIFLELDKDRDGKITKKEIKEAAKELEGLADAAKEMGCENLLEKAIDNLKQFAPKLLQTKGYYAENGKLVIEIEQNKGMVEFSEVGTKVSCGRDAKELHTTVDKDGDGKIESSMKSIEAERLGIKYIEHDGDGDGNLDNVYFSTKNGEEVVNTRIDYKDGKKAGEDRTYTFGHDKVTRHVSYDENGERIFEDK